MRNDLKNFAQSILDGLDVVAKMESAQRAVREAEADAKAARDEEKAVREQIAVRLQEADAHACAKVEAAEKEAEGIIRSAEDTTRVQYQAAHNDCMQETVKVRRLEEEKDELAADVAALRGVTKDLQDQKADLEAAIRAIKARLG